MGVNSLRTVWFPKDFPILLGLYIPWWGIGGLCWGTFMTVLTDGQLGKWLIAGMLWAAACWFFFAILLIITFREIWIQIPADDSAEMPRRLAQAAKRCRYTVEQESPALFVWKPMRRFPWVILLECTQVHVKVQSSSVDLIGPAFAVKRARKELLKTGAR